MQPQINKTLKNNKKVFENKLDNGNDTIHFFTGKPQN